MGSSTGFARARLSSPTLGLALGLALAACPVGADEPVRPRTTFESDRPAGRVVLAGANRDTLDYDWRDAYPVAIEELRDDHWTIQRADSAGGRIVTHWKPLKHVLARILLGSVMARCVVDLAPLPDGRTMLSIQGGLASDEDLAANPSYATAQSVYGGAAERWIGRVRRNLDERARRGLVARVEPHGARGTTRLEN